MSICQRRTKCHFCGEPILLREPVVKGKIWIKLGETKKWIHMMYWHAKDKDGRCCWIEEGLVAVGKLRYNQGHTGRKPDNISPSDKIERQKILRRHAAFIQRMRQAMDDGNVERVLRLYHAMQKLNEEIEKYGGIPESWIISTTDTPQCIEQSLLVVSTPQQVDTSISLLSIDQTYGSASIVTTSERSPTPLESLESTQTSPS
jgi:hypothetical protein